MLSNNNATLNLLNLGSIIIIIDNKYTIILCIILFEI